MNRRLLWIQTMKTKLKCQRKSISLIFMCLYMRTVLICTETLRCCLHRCYLTIDTLAAAGRGCLHEAGYTYCRV